MAEDQRAAPPPRAAMGHNELKVELSRQWRMVAGESSIPDGAAAGACVGGVGEGAKSMGSGVRDFGSMEICLLNLAVGLLFDEAREREGEGKDEADLGRRVNGKRKEKKRGKKEREKGRKENRKRDNQRKERERKEK